MRRIYKREDLVPGWELTRREAKASFANDDIYIEKLIENPRHIEISDTLQIASGMWCTYQRGTAVSREITRRLSRRALAELTATYWKRCISLP